MRAMGIHPWIIMDLQIDLMRFWGIWFVAKAYERRGICRLTVVLTVIKKARPMAHDGQYSAVQCKVQDAIFGVMLAKPTLGHHWTVTHIDEAISDRHYQSSLSNDYHQSSLTINKLENQWWPHEVWPNSGAEATVQCRTPMLWMQMGVSIWWSSGRSLSRFQPQPLDGTTTHDHWDLLLSSMDFCFDWWNSWRSFGYRWIGRNSEKSLSHSFLMGKWEAHQEDKYPSRQAAQWSKPWMH